MQARARQGVTRSGGQARSGGLGLARLVGDDDLARHRLIFYKCLVYLLIKLIALPALCIPIAVFMGLDGLRGQAAVYIASLPVALSSFSLANQ